MKELKEYLKQISFYNYASLLIKWDMDASAPSTSFEYMLEATSKYDLEKFKLITSPKYIKLINNVINSSDFKILSTVEQNYIYYLKEEYKRNKNVPKEFYGKYIELKNKSTNAYLKAKEENDFNIFKPYLKKLILETKKYYKFKYPNYKNLYDCMLNDYETNITSDLIDKLFNELKEKLLPIIKDLKPKKVKKISKIYTKEELTEISRYLLNYIGLDTSKVPLGIYTNAYTTKLNNEDVRISFPKKTDIIDHFLTTIHEGGHALFEENISSSLRGFENYIINKTAVHESIARFYENMLARNKCFWKPLYKDIKKILNLTLTPKELMNILNNVYPSLIRTSADELTYSIHIIIRYEIEKEIFNNNINVEDLPKLWNQKYKDYLGVIVKNDTEGILQDVHWSDASFGYFPSYLLGSIFDAMLLKKINETLGSVDALLKKGKVKEITKYLTKNILQYGGTYNINELSKRICKRPLEVKDLIEYFEKKYLK